MITNPLFEKLRAAGLSLLVHITFVLLLVISLDWSTNVSSPAPKVNIIKAVAVDQKRVEAELNRLKSEDEKKRKAEQARKKKLEKDEAKARKRRKAEEKRLAEAKRKLKKEKKRLAELEKKKKSEAKKLQQAEKKRLAEEKRAKAQAKKKREAKQRAEKKRKAEEAKRVAAEKARKAEEAKRVAAEKAKKVAAEKQRKEAEAAIQQALAEEQALLDRQRQQKLSGYQRDYLLQIRAKVERQWRRPPGMPAGLKCRIRVTQIPGGEVVNARIIEGSGNSAFDQSVEKAVLKASPLPLPKDPSLFVREFDFLFDPES